MAKTLLCAFLLCLSVSLGAQAQTTSTSNLLLQLLDLPAPPPVNKTSEAETVTKPERRESFYEAKNVPPDDAPIDVLLDFWERQNNFFDEFRYNLRPSKETLRRLIEEIEKDPQKLTSFIKLFPTDPDIGNFVKKLYAIEKQEPTLSGNWLDTVRRWLRYNSDMFLSELLADVRSIKDEDRAVSNQDELVALAKVDWNAAKPFVDAFERGTRQSGTYTLAKYVLYHRALEEENSGDIEKYRAELQQIVEDKTAGHKARDLAMDALVLGGDFEGRDEWYISLLTDETLLELQENGYTGLTTLVRYSPNNREKWLPLMTKLLNSGNPTLRSAAVRNLLQLNGFNKEIVLLLLPWVSDRAWATESGDNERDRLIEFISDNDVPESIPGLIRVLTNEEGWFRGKAAKALVRYKSPAAIPALHAALQNETDADYRANIIEALIVSGGISDAEQLAGLEAYAVLLSNKKDSSDDSEDEEIYTEDSDDDEPMPVAIAIGMFLKDYETPRDTLVSMTIQRIKALKKINPKVAAILSGIIQSWKSRVVDLEMLEWAGGAKADVETILKVLIRREEMLERIPNEISLMRDKSAILRALGAVIAENIYDRAYMLSRPDADSQIALLAIARLVRAKLPVREVGALLNSPNKTLALAAARYLESEDSAEARKLILAQRKGEALILGAQHVFIADEKKNYDTYRELLNDLFISVNSSNFWTLNLTGLNKAENELRTEFKTTDELLAVFAFIGNSGSGQKVLRVFKDKIVFTYYEDGARYWEKIVTPKEYEAMYNFIVANRIDDLAPITGCGGDCPNYEFVMLGRDGGRRIYYRQYSTPAPLDALEEIFDSFNKGERRLRYWAADKIPGLEVLMSDENFPVRALWKNGGDFRVLVEDKQQKKDILEDIERQEKTEDANESLNYSQRTEIQRQRRMQLAYKHYLWRKFENGRLGDQVSQPLEIAYLSENMQSVSWGNKYVYTPAPKTYRRRAENFEIRTESYYAGDLIKVFDSGASAVIKEGKYSAPVVTPDGKWVIASKGNEDSPQVTSIVRINLQTGKEFDVKIPTADALYPVAFADAHNKVLLCRARIDYYDRDKNNSSPKTPEFYLLDPNTGAFQLVKGEFRPLQDQMFRGLQPTGNPNEFWAAIYNEENSTTQIGFYDAKLFAFKPVLDLPKIQFDSMDIWIDKPAARAYFTYNGHLLALPLANAQNQP
jgi:hypothetical protein